jgi:hypothetical protein
MNRPRVHRLTAASRLLTVLAIAVLAAPVTAQRGPRRATARAAEHPVFMPGIRCALCHSLSPRATALRTATGEDASPHGLWSATMMANSFRDPFWRAQVAREIDANPGEAEAVQALCITCHAPMSHHGERLAGGSADDVRALAGHSLAEDGVSCTVCHQARPTALGVPASFAGRLDIRPGKRIFGPFPNPAPGPMRMHTGYTPEHGPHVQDSGLCGSCHTLHTRAHGVADAATFPEQTPYLEWRNSVYSDHGGATETSRSCQSCHMADLGSMRIARNPGGRDFNIGVRPNVRGHQMTGGNAFMLDLLATHRGELGVAATPETLARSAAATRAMLNTAAASVEVRNIHRHGAVLAFDVAVTNHTGHKFPSAYPSRRAWLQTVVQIGREAVFVSGGVDRRGRLAGIAEPLAIPHVDVVERPEQVPVYEMIAVDASRRPTTLLTRMTTRAKDTRLLPAGWRPDGPFADDTAPAGIGDDADFAAGGDLVHYRIPLPSADAGAARVTVWLRYQAVPPAWVEPMREVAAPETARFVRMYDAAEASPEAIAMTVAFEAR